MRPGVGRTRESGFTLMELLISIAIFAVVISSVYGAYRVTFQTVDSAEGQALAGSAGRVIMERMSEDLALIATDNDGLLRGKREELTTGRADSLLCIAYAHLDFKKDGKNGSRALIRYTTEEREDGRIDLYRYDRRLRPGEAGLEESIQQRGELLGRGLLSFTLNYVTADGREIEEWDSHPESGAEEGEKQEIELPVLVTVEIVVALSEADGEGVPFRTSVAIPVRPEEKETEEL